MGKKIGKYELGHTLGSGAFSKVKLATDTTTGQQWAVKIIDKEQLAREHLEEQLKREIAIMKALNHPHIVHLREVMQTHNHIYMVLEVVRGGELFDRIVEAKRFDEDTSRSYFQQLVAAVKYCHQQGIAHRDIKPENLLLDENNKLKISDFGLSNLQPTNRAGLLQTVCGTPNYVAPEVLKEKGYDGFKADAWSCGIVLFVMLAGYLPFDDQNQNALFNKIERGDYRMSRNFSDGARDLISKLIVVDPAKRLSLDQVMQHPWFTVNFNPDVMKGSRQDTTEADVNNAIQTTQEDEGSPAGKSAASKAAARPGEQPPQSPASTSGVLPNVEAPIDAFRMISMLTGGILGSHVVQGPVDVSKKTYHFLIQGDHNDLNQALQAVGCNIKQASSSNPREMRGFFNSGAHGLLTFNSTCTPTSVDGMSIAEIRRGRGDALEFQNIMNSVYDKMGAKLKSKPTHNDTN